MSKHKKNILVFKNEVMRYYNNVFILEIYLYRNNS